MATRTEHETKTNAERTDSSPSSPDNLFSSAIVGAERAGWGWGGGVQRWRLLKDRDVASVHT